MRYQLTRLFNSIWYGNNPLRWLLWPCAYLYQALAVLNRMVYRYGIRPTVELPVPVIVVGNISVGGTGKTPCVIWLARELRHRGYKVGIVTRGYGGRAPEWPQFVVPTSDPGQVGDESVLLARRTVSPVAAGPDRVAAAQLLLSQAKVDILLSDDGLQHHRMRRTIEIAVVDGMRGLGNGLCLPAGPLREPATRLQEVDAIVVNGGDWGHAGVFRGEIAPTRVVQVVSGKSRQLGDFKGASVHAVAGIGNPQRFFDMLEQWELDVDSKPLADHADISKEILSFSGPEPVMITEKDAVKCRSIAHDKLWCVVAELQFHEQDDERLMRLIMRQLGLRAQAQ